MDLEHQEEMQFLGLLDIYVEACKLICRQRKIFSQITLTLIIPLALIFLANEEISAILYWKIRFTEYRLHRIHAQAGTPTYDRLSDLVSSEWATYILFKAAYFIVLLIFSLLSTSAVVFTVASSYTLRETTFKKVMSVVPKVWKRLMVTFLCAVVAFFVYNTVFALTLVLWRFTVADASVVGPLIFVVVLVVYLGGFVYMTLIWHLASVVSVLEEDAYGLKAVMKSKDLIKGKRVVAAVIFLKLNFSAVFINSVFKSFVVYGFWGRHGSSVAKMVGLGVLCLLLLFKLILFGLVLQTILYFVCKSYHHERIEKSVLSDHLEVYLGEYVPLKSKDVQLGEYDPDDVI